jgi:hypothetical protein
MDRMIGIFQLLLSGVLGTMALSTLGNIVLTAMQAESDAVMTAAMGQLVVAIFLAVWARVFFVKGQERVRNHKP